MTFDLERNEFNYVFHQFDYLFKDMDGARFHEGEVVGILHGAKKDGITPGADYVYRFIQGLQERVRLEKKRNMRQKYKRCLAMAERCKYRMYHISEILDNEIAKIYPNVTAVKRNTWKKERMYYWRNLWLKLAEKFKEG